MPKATRGHMDRWWSLLGCTLFLFACEPRTKMTATVTIAPFGRVDGHDVRLYTLTNARGRALRVTNYGAIITGLHVPDRSGKLEDVVLGFDSLDGYLQKSPYFGAV